MPGRLVRWGLRGGAALAAVAVVIQLVPYGRDHANPPVVADAPWPTEEARAIAASSCYSCHSNETEWPWYSNVAPMSWLVQRDVDQGRDELNFSRWDRDGGEADDAVEAIIDGTMPPTAYTLMHPSARLSDDEVATIVAALREMGAD